MGFRRLLQNLLKLTKLSRASFPKRTFDKKKLPPFQAKVQQQEIIPSEGLAAGLLEL